MTNTDTRPVVTQTDLAHLGEGTVAYLREMGSEELKGKFPGLPDMQPGLRLWALFAADGRPILLSDARDRAIGRRHGKRSGCRRAALAAVPANDIPCRLFESSGVIASRPSHSASVGTVSSGV